MSLSRSTLYRFYVSNTCCFLIEQIEARTTVRLQPFEPSILFSGHQ